jgi:hypothetical protein
VTAGEFVDQLMDHVRSNDGHSVLWQAEFEPWTAECQNCGWTAQEPPS